MKRTKEWGGATMFSLRTNKRRNGEWIKISARRTGFTLLLFVFGWSSGLLAQAQTLSLAQCLELARQHSFRLQAAAQQVQAAGAVYRSGRSRYFPHVGAALSHAQSFYRHYDFRQQAGQAGLDWGIGDWLLQSAEAERKNWLAEEANREQIALEVTQRVAALYLAILQMQVKLELLANRRQLLNEHAQVANALWLAGARTQFDVLQTQAAIQQLQEEMLAAELEADNLRRELAQRLALPDYRALQLRDFPSSFSAIDSLAELRPISLQQNPLLKSLALQYEAQQLRLRQVRAARLPHLQFAGGYVVDRDPTAEGNYWQVGAGLQFPLFRWGLSKFQQQEIRAGARALQLQQAETGRELQIQLDQINTKLEKLREIYRAQEQRLEVNQKSFQLATANYKAGLITNLEYLAAQKDLTENQLTLQETRLSFLLGVIERYTLTNQTAKIAVLQGEK
ncbi:MAG: TolC family protein [candidate division KSB1 bacterium]|nr:TolC family protein [candidate division KSB1 bacterium]MDZ7302193.1 TolC family protein [candidate division KSB1 bacterium]MDZ7311302.1 TolC family protein [candidate division KSB1 bacterium]